MMQYHTLGSDVEQPLLRYGSSERKKTKACFFVLLAPFLAKKVTFVAW